VNPVVVAVIDNTTPEESTGTPGRTAEQLAALAHDLNVSNSAKYASSADATLRISAFARASYERVLISMNI
jgi:hypothetical protein